MDSQFDTLRVEAAVRPESATSVGVCNAPAHLRFSARTSRPAVIVSALFLLWMIPPGAFAQGPQQNTGRESGSRALPDAPVPAFVVPISARPSPAVVEGAATVEGAVLDSSGASVSGAEVSLRREDGTESQEMASGTNGEFNFTKIPAGSYLVGVNAAGFAPYTSEGFALQGQQDYEVPDFVLSVAGASTEMIVHPTEFIAAEQMRAAEKQRLMGVIPNFYTSYTYDTAPLTAKQKFLFAARGTFDPVAMVGVGFGAGIEQATNSFSGYGQGAEGYGKRFAAKFADGRSSDFFTHAIFPSLLHQDPRYYYQGTGSVKSRVLHAIGSAFFTRTDSGLIAPNYSFLLGDLSSGALSNLYYPKQNRGVGLVFTNAAVGLGGRMAGNILREFSKRLTTNTSSSVKP
ncbi:MAG: carboxypeptidase-like regulatory domain-containing protein [Candidatus Acidiferrales bacterium]